ncbi:hypothetical protein I314_02049 [Cryptococcus bacillisporus CA1873]|uniref:Unplaced genomic scaffold supercont1.4, whole genome shotgun sequence n=2 Tax=Cryptococcus gattii TaxID=552467 RepID=A0A0D0TQ37_CRYGA|nr:hypothetical protein I312_01877 [Cryptococcus bacillisporus CA1280]KIR67632.1 hypothetical protein I314_02049 [Cryptococcus bacillisporus CA1873]|eukprot:KIR67632.1 hypothetical protein I314_02049 [Cryptococcus gattii CA1873]
MRLLLKLFQLFLRLPWACQEATSSLTPLSLFHCLLISSLHKGTTLLLRYPQPSSLHHFSSLSLPLAGLDDVSLSKKIKLLGCLTAPTPSNH